MLISIKEITVAHTTGGIYLIDLFEGIERFGLEELTKEKPLDLWSDGDKESKSFNILDYVFEKSYECPVCLKNFKSNTVKSGKLKLESVDYDLRPIFTPIEPMLYEVIICNSCGYSAIKQNFFHITDRQGEFILKTITPQFKPVNYPMEMELSMGIDSFKLALLNTIVKKGRDGEKGYICLKLAWLYRLANDKERELTFIQQAYEGLVSALTKERTPICGMDENTILYLLATFCYRLGKFDEGIRHLSKLIVAKTSNTRLKERARDLKDMIQQQAKHQE